MTDEKARFERRPNEICAAWKKQTGNFLTVSLSSEQIKQLQKIQEGDRILIKMMSPQLKRNENSPDAYLEIFKGGN